MLKVQVILIAILIASVTFVSCTRIQQVLGVDTAESEPVEMGEMPSSDAATLLNALTITGAELVSGPPPEPSSSMTAPRIEGGVPEMIAASGSTVSLPFAYSGTNNLAGCIVYVDGVDAYYRIPYTGAPEDLPSAIAIGLPEDSGVEFIEVCYGVYDDQGQTGNFIMTVIRIDGAGLDSVGTGTADVLIYTGATWWITQANARIEAEITRSLLQSAGIQAEITENQEAVRDWTLQKTGDGRVNVLIVYGVIPTTIYTAGNAEPDGSVAENYIETSDGDTILNQADYFGWSSSGQSPDPDYGDLQNAANGEGALQNLMDISDISISLSGGQPVVVTEDGVALTPSLSNFDSDRPLPLDQLQGEWVAEIVFGSDTGNAEATHADPVIVRDGNRGRLALVYQTQGQDNPKGEVTAEVIINYLLK